MFAIIANKNDRMVKANTYANKVRVGNTGGKTPCVNNKPLPYNPIY